MLSESNAQPQSLNQFSHELGCLLGLVLGDALCAPYEGGPLERGLWSLLGKTKNGRKRWTDDTQMSLDSIRSLLAKGGINQDHLAACFAASYRWSRGYGPAAARLLKKIKRGKHWSTLNCAQFAQGSFGNGAAMRAPVLAIFYRFKQEALSQAITDASIITHAHPLAVAGAQMIGAVVRDVLNKQQDSKDNAETAISFLEIAARAITVEEYRNKIRSAQQMRDQASSKEIAKTLGNGVAAINSTVTAVYIAQRFRAQPFLEMIEMIKTIGGDADTIAAMAGSIWGASNGFESLPQDILPCIERSEEIMEECNKLCMLRDGAEC